MKARIVFLGTPEFACPTLDTLLAEPEHYEMCAVITQPDRRSGRNLEIHPSRVKMLAENVQISRGHKGKKFPILTPESVNTPQIIKLIGDMKPDLAVVVAFGQILSPAFLNCFRLGGVNVHASILPRWRGAAPIAWAIISEDPVTGVTLQKLAQKLDSGDIISSAQVDLDENWDGPRLYSELSKRGAELVRKHLPEYIEGKITPTPQNEQLVTWAPKIKKEQGLIDWTLRAREICARIKAFTPWPGVWTTRVGKQLKILRANAIEFKSAQPPGFLVSQDKMGFAVQCGGATALMVTVVQPESRARQAAGEYLKGYPFVKGERLGD